MNSVTLFPYPRLEILTSKIHACGTSFWEREDGVDRAVNRIREPQSSASSKPSRLPHSLLVPATGVEVDFRSRRVNGISLRNPAPMSP